MKAHVALAAVLALGLGTNVRAGDEACSEGRPHTHWWLEPIDLPGSWYAGVSASRNEFKDWSLAQAVGDGSFTSRHLQNDDTGMGFLVGADFGRYLGLKFGYTDFGEARFRGQNDGSGSFYSAGPVAEDASAKGFELSLLGSLPLTGTLSVFGKAGLSQWKASVHITGSFQCCGDLDFSDSENQGDTLYGAGLRYDGFRPIRLVAEYTKGDWGNGFLSGESEVESLGLSLAYLFNAD